MELVLLQVLAGKRTSQLSEGVTMAEEVTTGTLTITGEKTGKVDLHKSNLLLLSKISPTTTFSDVSCGKGTGCSVVGVTSHPCCCDC